MKPIVAATKVFEGAAMRTRFAVERGNGVGAVVAVVPLVAGAVVSGCAELSSGLPSTVTARTKPPTARATNAAMPRSQRRVGLRAPASSGH